MNRTDFIANLRGGRDQLHALWRGLTDEQMTERPAVQEDWSVKDLIAHLTYWQRFGLENTQYFLGGSGGPSGYNVDEVNARVFQENKDRPLADIQADYERSVNDMIDWLNDLSDQQLANLTQPAWREHEPLWEYLAGESYEHYEQHFEDLRNYVQKALRKIQ